MHSLALIALLSWPGYGAGNNVAFPTDSSRLCYGSTMSNISRYRQNECTRVLALGDRIPREHWQLNASKTRAGGQIYADFDFYHRLWGQAAWDLMNAGALNSGVYSKSGGHFGLRPFNELSREQIAELIRQTARMQGSPNMRAIVLYLHGIPQQGEAKPLPADEVMRAIAEIEGSDFAWDVLMNEGLNSPNAAIRLAAIEGLTRRGASALQAIVNHYKGQDEGLGRQIEQLVKEENDLKQKQLTELAALRAKLAADIESAEQEKASREARLAEERRSLAAQKETATRQLRELERLLNN